MIINTRAWRVALPLLLAVGSATAAPPPPPADPMLRGPDVDDEVVRSLVPGDLMGGFRQLQGRPEEAALDLLPFDAERQARVREARDARIEALDRFLVEHIDLVRDVTDAIRAGDNDQAGRLGREMYERFDPEQQRDPLLANLSSRLTDDDRTELARLLDEYWTEWVDWELRNVDRPDAAAKATVEQRLKFQLFQQELRLAYERTLRPYHDKLQEIYTAVEPTPEQRAALRALVIDYIRETRLGATSEQRQALAKEIYFLLDEDRRIRLIEVSLSQL